MLVYRTESGIAVGTTAQAKLVQLKDVSIDQLFTGEVSTMAIRSRIEKNDDDGGWLPKGELLPPIGTQEVWAAGVTYRRSRTARMDESADSGASSFYDKIYHAHRPELFFKATPHRVVGSGGELQLRRDSEWMVPEPELTLAIKTDGTLLGFTIGNDLSSRDIEGENPLYLPQAKIFDRCAGLGPALWLTDQYPDLSTRIKITIHRDEAEMFAGETEISQMKQTFPNLVEHLYRECSFPAGCFLMTGTGLVPPDEFSLQPGDKVTITIDPVGTLVNLMR